MEAQTRLDGFGRVVIPKKVRQRLGLVEGAILEVVTSGADVLLRPRVAEAPFKRKHGILVFSGELLDPGDDIVSRHREERLASFLPKRR